MVRQCGTSEIEKAFEEGSDSYQPGKKSVPYEPVTSQFINTAYSSIIKKLPIKKGFWFILAYSIIHSNVFIEHVLGGLGNDLWAIGDQVTNTGFFLQLLLILMVLLILYINP